MKELFIKQEENIKKIYLIENNIIIEKHEESEESPMLEGNIYVGKVQNVLPGMQAAFVNIGSGRNAFIHLRDILPKTDVTQDIVDNQENDIRKLIRPGEPIIVQVTRDKSYKKGARVTKHISFTGRFFVYMPSSPFIAVSQKISDETKKKELKDFVANLLPKNSGGIIRTNAIMASKEDIIEDVNSLIKKWENLMNMDLNEYPKELYSAGGILKKYLLSIN